MKKNIILTVLFTLISLFIFNMNVNADTTSTEGKINVSKSSQKSNQTYGRSTEVTLTVSGNSYMQSNPTDVVLVLDRSKSMDGNKWTATANAAKDLVNALITEDNDVNVGVVSFARDVLSDYSSSALTNNKTTLTSLINSIPNPGLVSGTNIQAGLLKANNLLSTSNATNKVVILLSDGEPNYYINSNGNIKSGSSQAAASTLSAATTVKANATLYTIGFETDSDAEVLLKKAATDNKFYKSSTSEIISTFSDIFNEINTVANNTKVEDIIPAGFTIDESTLPSNCALSTTEEGLTKLTWTIGTISSEVEDYSISYTLNANENYYGSMNTNESAILSATTSDNNPYYEGTSISEMFEVPYDPIPAVTNNDSYTLDAGSTLNVNIEDNDELASLTKDKDATVTDKVIIVDENGDEATLSETGLTVNEDGTLAYESTYSTQKVITFNYIIETTVKVGNTTEVVKSNTSTVTINVKKVNTSYVVKYLEQDTNKVLKEQKEVTGKYLGDEVTEDAAEIEDYVLVNEDSQTITLAKTGNEIIFYYALPDVTDQQITKTGTQTVEHSLDSIEYNINYDTTIKNYKGTATITVTDTLPYEIDTTKSTLNNGQYNAENKTITWTETIEDIDTFTNGNYEYNFNKNIKVVYKDMDPTNNFTNTVNAYVHLLEDGEKVEDSAPTTVNIKGNLIVKYLDENNNPLITEKTTTEKVGTDYTTTEETVEGYTLKEVQGDEAGKYIEGDITVIYVYSKIKPKLEDTIINKTGTTTVTSSDDIIKYTINYSGKIKDYKGDATLTIVDTLPYGINENESDLNGGIYNSDNKTITWTENITGINTFRNGNYNVNYTKNIKLKFVGLDATKTTFVNNVIANLKLEDLEENDNASHETSIDIKGVVEANYLNESGEKISDSEITSSKVGNDYQTTAKEIFGYKLKEINGEEVGKYTEDKIVVDYIYSQIPKGTVIVSYVDELGKKLTEDITTTDFIENEYTTSQKDFDNYEFVKVEGDVSGVYTEGTTYVKYIYKLKETEKILTTTTTEQVNYSSAPQTGVDNGSYGIGFIIFTFINFLLIVFRKRFI